VRLDDVAWSAFVFPALSRTEDADGGHWPKSMNARSRPAARSTSASRFSALLTEAAATGNKVGSITPAGVVSEHAIPTAGSNPQSIVAGSDGNLWFTELDGHNIGRITPADVVTEFPHLQRDQSLLFFYYSRWQCRRGKVRRGIDRTT
jgi:hypothetical protein